MSADTTTPTTTTLRTWLASTEMDIDLSGISSAWLDHEVTVSDLTDCHVYCGSGKALMAFTRPRYGREAQAGLWRPMFLIPTETGYAVVQSA